MTRPTNRKELLVLHREGYSNRRIALICGMAHATVDLHMRDWRNTGREDVPIYAAPPSQAKPVPAAMSEAAQHRKEMEAASLRLLREMALAFQRGDHLPCMARAA